MSRILPILFNTEMVRAILEGRKTATRRVLKPQPIERLAYAFAGYRHGTWGYPNKNAWQFWGESFRQREDLDEEERKKRWMPPYQVDDILYVRETVWQEYETRLDVMTGEICFYDIMNSFRYCATDKEPRNDEGHHWRKRPSIHMPKEAARIWLKVKRVRVERLQDMTLDDCHKEGINIATEAVTDGETVVNHHDWSLERFETLWDSTVKKSDIASYGWDANPWVWVIEFERCGKPESDMDPVREYP